MTAAAALKQTDRATLDDRIRHVLTGAVTSAEAQAVIADANARIAWLVQQQAAADKRSLEPLLSSVAVDAALDEFRRTELEARRLRAALDDLAAKLAQVSANEDEIADGKRFAAAIEKREAVFKQVREAYPRLGKDIADLMRTLIETDELIRAANARQPKALAEIKEVHSELFSGYPVGHHVSGLVRIPAMIPGRWQFETIWPQH